jgi:DNA polymerase III alpha subunit
MRNDIYGNQILSEDDVCELYMSDANVSIKHAVVENNIIFPEDLEIKNLPNLIQYIDPQIDISEFDRQNQNVWFMPEEYKDFDIAKFILDQCKDQAELQRAGEELILYQERDMFMLLRYLKYLVDTMRKHKVVWGVGRGSSVASFVLYLLGVHKINSLYYDLPIDEFLK